MEQEKNSCQAKVESSSALLEPEVNTDDYPQGVKLGFIIIGLLFCLFLAALDMTIVATAIPKITDDFHSVDEVGWYGSAFFLTLAAFQSSWGKLYRYCNLKYTYIAAGLIFEIGSLICGTARNSTSLIIGRAITGVGGAGLYCGTYTIIAFIVPREKRSQYTGLVGFSYAIASVAGPLIGGVFTDSVSWRWCFYVNLPIGGFSIGLIQFLFEPPRSAKPVKASLGEIVLQLDPLGTATILAALVCLLLAMQWAGATKAWDSASVIACLVLFGVLTTIFSGIQFWMKERASLVPRILVNRTIIGISIFAFFQNGVNFYFTYYIPVFFQSIDNYSAAQSGIYNLPLIFGACLFAIISGFLIAINGYYTFFMAIGSGICTIAAGLLYTIDMNTPLRKPLGYQVLLGVGQGLAIQVPVIVAQSFAKPEDMSPTTAIVLFFQMTGGTICISSGQAIFINRLLYHLAQIAPQIDTSTVLAAGASQLRQVIPADEIEFVLRAYFAGLKDTFALGIALAGCGFLTSWIAPVKDLKKMDGVGAESALALGA